MSAYRDNLPPKRHRWRECGFNRACIDCNGLWCYGTPEPKSPCDNGDSNTKITDCKVLE